jgi:hypothetical protein
MLTWAKDAETFRTADWEQRAREEWTRHGRDNAAQGEWESDETYEQRVEQDLTKARGILQEMLGLESNVLCWPENAFSEVSERVARRVGFAATVSNRHDTTNAVGGTPDRIVRVFVGESAAGIRSDMMDCAGFALELKSFEGSYIFYPILFVFHRAKRLAFALQQRLSRCPNCALPRSGQVQT